MNRTTILIAILAGNWCFPTVVCHACTTPPEVYMDDNYMFVGVNELVTPEGHDYSGTDIVEWWWYYNYSPEDDPYYELGPYSYTSIPFSFSSAGWYWCEAYARNSDNLTDYDCTDIFVIKTTIGPHTGGIPYQSPAAATISYTISPDDSWLEDYVRHNVQLIITGSSGVIRTINLPQDLGSQSTTWDGKKDDGSWAPVGDYTATIEMRIGASYFSDSCTIRVGQPEVTFDVQSTSSLDESTIVFNLNGTIISNSSLTLERTYVTDHGRQMLRSLRVKYRPSNGELNIPGTNTVRFDISDMAGNAINQLVYNFQVIDP